MVQTLFRNRGITGARLLELDHHALVRDVGVKNESDVAKVLLAIDYLKGADDSFASSV